MNSSLSLEQSDLPRDFGRAVATLEVTSYEGTLRTTLVLSIIENPKPKTI